MTRVFITGMGALTPIGNDVQTFWQNLLAGKSGATKLTLFETGDMPYNIACEVKNFDPPVQNCPVHNRPWLDSQAERAGSHAPAVTFRST